MKDFPLLYHTAAAGNPVVLGLRLSTFTLGHAILLHRLESPFVREGDIVAESVAITARILSTPWRKSVRDLKSKTRKLEFFIWSLFVLRKADWQRESAMLQEWMYLKQETLKPEATGGGSMSCPWPERLLILLTGAGLPIDDALDLPVVDAERLSLTWAEAHGHAKVWGDPQERLRQIANAHAARLAAEYEKDPQAFRESLERGIDPMLDRN